MLQSKRTAIKKMVIKEFGYEYDAKIKKSLYKKTFGKCTYEKIDGAYALRSGRDALKAIAREYRPSIAFLPSLSCDSMILPFKMYGHNVVYYKLNESMHINVDCLFNLLKQYDDAIILFLYMNYFGIETISSKDLLEIRNKYKNVIFINDITHIFPSYENDGNFDPDYKVASLRKWISIPDGGLLWCKKDLTNKKFEEDTSFAYKRLEAQQMRYDFLESGNIDLKNKYRNIFSTVSNIIDNNISPARMTQYSFELFKKIDFKLLASVRKNNAIALKKVLSTCPKIRIFHKDVNISNLYVPFIIDNRDLVQSKLNEKGVFNTIIWPINNEQKSICENAKYMEEHMLAAPCDQRYTIADMEFIGKEILEAVNE